MIEYEGDYLNGIRQGKGKEFNGSRISFEGENKNNKRNWKGIEYDEKDKLKYEGEYLDGKRNGKGKEINDNYKCHSEFEGEYLNGKRWNGFGKRYKLNHKYINFKKYEI